jgi:DNA mismatch repair protein MutS2
MMRSLAALEFDRVLRLVAHFTRSARGRSKILSGPPRFDAGAGLAAFEISSELAAHLGGTGTLAFDGLDGAELLENPVDLDTPKLLRLVALVRLIVEIRTALAPLPLGPALAPIVLGLPRLDALLAHCDRCLSPGGEVPDTASTTLGRARAGRERARQQIVTALEAVRRGRRELGAPYTLRRDRYCLPVPSSERSAVPGLVLDSSGSGATLFVEPFGIVDLNNALAEATAVAREEEERILRELAVAIGSHREALLSASETLAELDAVEAKVLFGRAAGGVMIQPGAGDRPRLVGARHPLLDPALADLRRDALGEEGNRRPIVPLDLEMPEDRRLLLLSGPNAGGKTVALKTFGLVALMAQAGIPALVEEGSALPRFSGVWCHVGDEQNLLSELSTFSAAMGATATLLASADENTLALYDELGSGTDPEEGASLAAALLEELAARRCWTVATAHLVTVAAHVEQLAGAVNAAMGFDETTGRPTYRLSVGVPGRSRALAIARRCGVPAGVLERARDLLSRGLLTIDAYLERLQLERDRLTEEREALARARVDADAERERADAQRGRLEAEQRRVAASLAHERDAFRRKARTQLDEALAELRREAEAGSLPGKRRLATLRTQALATGDEEQVEEAPDQLTAGSVVRVRGSSIVARVTRVEGGHVELVASGTRTWVDAASCELVAHGADAPSTRVTVEGETSSASEIKLIGLSREEAREELERFLDRALLAGVRSVRIVHGHGSGTLRRMVQEALAEHPAVATFTHPPQRRGGTGVTEAELER